MLKKSFVAIPALILAAQSSALMAYEKGDLTVRVGAALVEPNDSSTAIDINTPDLGAAGNAKAGVGTDTQLGLTFSYMISDDLAVELLGATPFEHDIVATGAIAGVGKLGSTKHLPPTLSLNYFPMASDGKLQPYVGLGVNYTIFFEEDTTSTLDSAGTIDALATLAGAAPGTITSASDTDLSLDNSFGFAFNAGVNYKITEELGVSLSYWKIQIETDAEITTQTNIGEVVANTTVTIDPSVYMIGVNYTF